jgi:activator of HSP90 ATPase
VAADRGPKASHWDTKDWERAWELSKEELRKRLAELGYRGTNARTMVKADLVKEYLDLFSVVSAYGLYKSIYR